MSQKELGGTKENTQSHVGVHTFADDIQVAKDSGNVNPQIMMPAQTMRTLSSDLASALVQKKTGMVGLALAEEEKRRMLEEGGRVYSKQNMFFIVASVVLVIAGIILVAFLYLKKNNSSVDLTNTISFPSYIFTDDTIMVDLSDQTQTDIQQLLNTALSGTDGQTIAVYPTITNGVVTSLLSLADFVKKLELDVPQNIIQSFSPTFMLGVSKDGTESRRFVVLKTTSEESARLAMMSFEPTIYNSIGTLFFTKMDLSVGESPWRDTVFYNKDSRALYTNENQLVLLYTFLDKETMIITADADMVALAIDRLDTERIAK